MPFKSDSDPWLSSFRIWNLIRSSLFCDFSASAKAATMPSGAGGLPSVWSSGRPIR